MNSKQQIIPSALLLAQLFILFIVYNFENLAAFSHCKLHYSITINWYYYTWINKLYVFIVTDWPCRCPDGYVIGGVSTSTGCYNIPYPAPLGGTGCCPVCPRLWQRYSTFQQHSQCTRHFPSGGWCCGLTAVTADPNIGPQKGK